MAYDTTEAVAKFLSGFQMKITNRERDTVAPDYYVKYSLTLSKGGKDFSTTFVSDPRASGEPTVTQVFSALADDALTLRKYSTDEFVDKLYAQGVKPSAALRADGFPRGSKKGNPPCADTMVEFYDTEDNGQFVASFHMNTLLGYPWNGMVGADLDGLEAYGFAYPLSTQAATDWLEGDDLAKVNVFLKETCKEAFGILPGADDGGYSLSGEAKEAALSRFALPENRKAALDVIRKLNESRDSNDNAI